MSLLQWGNFTLHAGGRSWWRIDCDSLTDSEINLIAKLIHERIGILRFTVCPDSHPGSCVPKLVDVMNRLYAGGSAEAPILIVDDVLTTGSSMIARRSQIEESMSPSYYREGGIVGAVIFARGPCPDWIMPLFQFTDMPVREGT